ncbi:hemagglutinin repeat-containing protein [Paraburkholderia sp. A1RI-2L]|uniref:hemagglutinin repeat-containing protein n=1 Tax=Paraburkholderia sp. A1RI-2L TaxID=3028367 RepID=UPI003B7EAE66
MNKKLHRLVFSKTRGMLVAVEETATSAGKETGQTRARVGHAEVRRPLFTLRQIAFAALALLGAMPVLSHAQIVGGGTHAPNVIQTQNGLDQVNINRPSGAGVSVNTYNQFDVQQRGAILNNSPTMVQSQLGGMINGNPNFAAGQSARVIVNQINSASASQLNGALEVAGQRANVILANPSGISVNGGTFINTSRATLTTGTPNYAPDGSVSGFNVRGGNITVSGAGLNVANVDQVDLLARAVQANAAIYAKTLNVVTGANSVDYTTLNATPIAGDGPAPGVSIDVSQLGGMYSGKITLVGTEAGVGISLKGIAAAQSGDLVLTTQGKLVLAGQTNASGNIVANARDGIDNTGTTYAQQSVSLSTGGTFSNSATLAAQQNTGINAGSVSSTGTLAAGVNGDGSLAQSGDLNVNASGGVTATGRNVAGGNASVSGAALNLAGSTNSAKGALVLAANGGDLNLSGATTTAGGTLDARAAGTLTNDSGALSSGGAQTITAGALSNRNGQIVSNGTLSETIVGTANNQGGTMQSSGAFSASTGAFDNAAGQVTSLSADGLSLTTASLLNNGSGGSIGGNGSVALQGGQIANAGSITAVQTLIARAVQTLFNSGTFAANGALTLAAGTTLSNTNQLSSAGALGLSAATFDNSGGTASAGQIALHATNLVNHAGRITQTGTGATTLDVSGTLDNSAGGTLQTNSTDLTLAPGTLDNDGGTITHAGNGRLSINAGNGASALSNAGGTIASNGQVALQGGTLNNAAGSVTAQNGLTATLGGALNNTNGKLLSNTDLGLTSGTLNNNGGQIGAGSNASIRSGTLTNNGGSFVAPNLTVSTSSTLDNTGGDIEANQLALNAANLLNHSGTITQYGVSPMGFNVSGLFDNSNGGTLQTNSTDLTLASGTLDNDGGTISHAGDGKLSITAGNGVGTLSNAGGTITSNGQVALQGSTLNNAAGSLAAQNGLTATLGALNNTDGKLLSNTDLGVTSGTLNNNGGQIGAGSNASIHSGTLTNNGGSIVGPNLTVTTDTTLDNTAGDIEANQLDLKAANLVNHGGAITQYGALLMGFNVSGLFDNSNGGTLQTNSTDLALAPGTLDNDGGTISHAGNGKLSINAGNGAGALSNVAGTIVSNGQVSVQGDALDNTSGSIIGQNGLTATFGGALNNTDGKLLSNTGLSLASGTLNNNSGQIGAGSNASIHSASLTNNGGSFVAPNLTVSTSSTLDNTGGDIEANQLALNAANLLNHSGTITQYGVSPMGFNVSGLFDNSNGGTLQTNSTDLTLASGTLDNDGGTILSAGTGTLTIAPGYGAGLFSNIGGRIIAAGQIAVQAASLNNLYGVLAAQGNIAANIAGDLNNTQGSVRSLSSLSLTSGGTLTNTNGQIQSGTGVAGDASTLAIQAAAVDNTNGLVSDLGTGDATVQGDSQTVNSGGVITGNGNVAVNTSALLNTQNGQLSGANVTVRGDTVDNSGGQIGTFAGSGSGSTGDVSITTTSTVTNTNGQIGATHDLSVTAAALTGGGSYSAANDVAISVQGDFTPTPEVQFAAGHDLAFTLPGTFSNDALLEAANNLKINAGDVQNTGTMMAGGTLATHSNTLENTGVIVGGSVSLNATQTLSNLGPTALIGATDSNGTLELLSNDIENRDDTTATDTQATTAIYGLGKVVLAGGKNADGSYTNAGLIRNQSALIESAGDMELHASQVTNTRTTMTTTGFNQPVDPALMEQLGVSMSGCTASVMAACDASHPFVGWTTGDASLIGGMPVVPPHGGQWNSGWQYTTYTGVAVANLIAGISPQAQIIAGGNLDTSNVGLFQNDWSAVAAVGNIAAPMTLDQNSWRGQTAPGVQVTYSGYYHYTNYDHSIADWTLPFGNAPFVGSNPGGYTQAAPADIRNYALPSYESSFVAGGTLSGNGISINNTAGNAGIPSLGLAPGQAMSGVSISGLSGNASGTNAGGASTVSGNAGGTSAGGASTVAGNAGGTTSGTTTVAGGGSATSPVIASATAQAVLQNLSIPQGGLFRPVTTPGAGYLIETNPAFTNQKTFISSDYYLQQLGLNPQTTEKRLGDGFYEQQLVRNQITSLTGKAVLGPYTDLQGMYESLLAAGASLSKSLDLPLGMSLSPEQVAALTGNVIIMQTETVNGQSVLVPVVYLAKASQQNMNGPLIAATDIDIQNAQTFTNSGTVQASNTMSIQGQQINNAFGALQSGGLMSLTTKGNVDLTSAKVNAGSLALNAGGDVLLNTAVKTVNQVSATGATRTTSTLGPIASVNVAGDAVVVTGGNFEQHAGNLNVGGNLGMAVGGNYDIGTVQTGEHKVVERANGVSNTDINQVTGSSVNVGGVSQIGVGGDLTATGANINLGGGGVVAANGNVTLQAAKATSTIDSNSSGSDSHGSYSESSHRSDDTLTATTLNAGNSLTVASGKDISLTGSAISLDKGTATLAAAGNVNIGAATQTHVDNSQEQHKHSNVVSGKEVASSSNTTATLSQGSMVSADAVTIASGNDINVKGGTIVGTNDVALNAAHDVNITTTQDTMQSSSSYQEKRTGLGTSGLTVTVGTNKLATTDEASSVTNNASTVGSLNGDLSIHAGNTLHVTGSDLVAGGNLAGTAANVIIDAATDTAHQAQTQKTSSSGLTIGLAGSVGDAINNAYSESQAAKNSTSTGNDRAAALHSIAAAGDVALAGAGVANPAGGGKPDIGIKVSIGSSKSESQSSEDQVTQRGSNIQAGGTAAFVATTGDVTIAGSNVSANDVVLAAKNQVNVINTTDTDSTRSSNSSSSASIGVQYTAGGGFGVSAAMSNAHGDANSDASIQNASHVNGANSVTVISGGDTNIIGSQVNGKQIAADVGGNLNITSVQDVTNSAAHQSSTGGGFTISQYGGASASVTAQRGHADGDYAGVSEQAGINAGDGGFNVNVKGNTDLKGGVISSAADASQNSLTTGTLTFSDVENHSHYSANSAGISAGAGVGSTGKAVGPGSTPGGAIPMALNESGDQSATTRSAIGAGTINITNGASQAQDIGTLSRDTTDTNGTVAKTPDVNNILNQQADTMAAARAAGQVVAQGIAAYAGGKQAEAQKAADAAKLAGDMDAYAKYQAEANSWAEGGQARTELHIAGGALLGGLGGGSIGTALQGAAGAGVASAFADKLNGLAGEIGSATGSTTLGNVASNVLAGVGGAAVGGGMGGFTASNADLYNRQLHPDEKKKIADKANGDAAEEKKLTQAACYAVKCWAEYAPGSAEYNANYVSQLEASQLVPELQWVNNQKEAGLFNYTPTQKITDMVQSDPLGTAKDAAKVVLGGVTTKTGVGLCTSGLGCAAGVPMAAFGASDMVEGADGLYNRYNGISSPGTNPLRNEFNQALPDGWGNAVYDGLNLATAIGALYAPVPLKMGVADGLNRPGSMFDVTVPRINNNWLIPFTGQAAPYGINQGILIFGVGSKGAAVINDIRHAGDQK